MHTVSQYNNNNTTGSNISVSHGSTRGSSCNYICCGCPCINGIEDEMFIFLTGLCLYLKLLQRVIENYSDCLGRLQSKIHCH